MRNPFIVALLFLLFSCGNNKPSQEQKDKADRYVQSLVDAEIGIYKGELTDANFLILAVDAYPGANFDAYARTYLEEAQGKGLKIKGVYIVDIKNCQFGDGWVSGDRIGKAFK
ncbi:hypothetical protein [Bacteroides mediterraneensis]|uniref:hypothetical protein n=1 Tax=Bacteroides mediterraneensis TaxID=1841856 RepID=UPI003D2FDB6E